MSRFALLLSVTCSLALTASGSAAPPVAGQAQPSSLPIGTLYVGAIAEASFLVYAPADDPNPKIKVDAPKFVKVLNTGTHAQALGKNGAFTCVTVEVAVNTERPGELKGEIVVTIGEMVSKVPVSAAVKTRKPGTPRVLVVGTPFERYSLDDGKRYKQWTDVVDAAGLDVSCLLIRDKTAVFRDLNLNKYDSVLVSGAALVLQTDGDVKRVRAFAEGGGRVVVATAAFLTDSIKGANAILDGYGLEMLNQEPKPALKEVTLSKDDFAADVVKAGIGSAAFFRASPVDVQNGGRVLVNAVGFDKPGLGFVATAKVGKGDVFAIGVPLWWYWVSEGDGKGQAKGSDNAKLLGWLLAPPRKG